MIGAQISNASKSIRDNTRSARNELNKLDTGRNDLTIDIDGGACEESGDGVLLTISDNLDVGVGSTLIVGELNGDDGIVAGDDGWSCRGSGGEEGKNGSECGPHFDRLRRKFYRR